MASSPVDSSYRHRQSANEIGRNFKMNKRYSRPDLVDPERSEMRSDSLRRKTYRSRENNEDRNEKSVRFLPEVYNNNQPNIQSNIHGSSSGILRNKSAGSRSNRSQPWGKK